MHYHRTLQRRIMLTVGIVVVLAVSIGIPMATNDGLRYDTAKQLGLVPGRSAEQIADADDNATLIILPLDNGSADGTSPWLYRAQFIAWRTDAGMELEHLETGERVALPLASISFISANGDGSLVLLRGTHADSGETASFTISPESMELQQLANGNAVPDADGDWTTPVWEKVAGQCNRPSPHKRFVGCFTRANMASYLAGDWQLDLQVWGDFDSVFPLYRGEGFVPQVGFAQEDTVVYMQNETGIMRVNVPDEALAAAPSATPFMLPTASPEARMRPGTRSA